MAFQARWLILGVGIASLIAWLVEYGAARRHAWKEVWWSVGIAFVISLALSVAFGKMRPFLASSSIEAWIPPPSSLYAFPSTHAAVMWAWAAGMAQLERSWIPLWVFVAFVVSVSRVASGVHAFSDILAGACVGVFAWAVVRFGHRASRALIHAPHHE